MVNCVFLSPEGIIIFVHGSGSGRHSPRNQFVAEKLNEDGLATLLLVNEATIIKKVCIKFF
jgi:predicted alpha/beta-hydrolase family hydrolase